MLRGLPPSVRKGLPFRKLNYEKGYACHDRFLVVRSTRGSDERRDTLDTK